MLSNIASLQLRGGNFDNETNLELFPNDNSSNNKYIKSVVIFGRNGQEKVQYQEHLVKSLDNLKHLF
uniref:Uncharacterized protein n=1 Tax=Lactobacillus johnsonii TaxID=33959 RepID=A0A9W3SK81_LACJH|nr:hypothetical protein [Lactobacillus johnsonii]AOG25763.1 hypothetical protein BBP16_02115 [Lactobacillus johnsonii]